MIGRSWQKPSERNGVFGTSCQHLPSQHITTLNIYAFCSPACSQVFGTMIPSVEQFLGMDWNHLPALHENRWDTPDWCRLIMIWCTVGSMGMTEKSDGAMCSSAFNPCWGRLQLLRFDGWFLSTAGGWCRDWISRVGFCHEFKLALNNEHGQHWTSYIIQIYSNCSTVKFDQIVFEHVGPCCSHSESNRNEEKSRCCHRCPC